MSKMKIYKEGLKYVLKFWPYLILCIVTTSIVTLLATYSPTLIANVLNIISKEEQNYGVFVEFIIKLFSPETDFEIITCILIFYSFISILIFALRYLTSIFYNLTGLKIERKVREDAIAKLNELPIDYFSLEPDGKIVAKITSDSNGVRLMFNVSFNIIQAFINIGVVYFALIAAEPTLALYMLIVVPILLLWITVYRKRIHNASERIRELSSRITGKLAELINGTSIIQAYNQEENMMNEYKELVFSHNDSDRKVNTVSIFFGWELIQ
ncbi:MAG: ABC transporter transmembrane domain-containing protein, partial [bacterium]